MSVVVSDTSPLHYLILCQAEFILPNLFQKVVIPTAVFRELQSPHAPLSVRQWFISLPNWVEVQTPKAIDSTLRLDPGELEGIALAKEINAAAILIDDRAGRIAAHRSGIAVIGTIGLLERAAARGLLRLTEIFELLRQTNAGLDPGLVEAALERDRARRSV